jgi:hypothetical protein
MGGRPTAGTILYVIRSFVIGSFSSSVIGAWLSAIGYRLSAIGYWLLAILDGSFSQRSPPFVICHLSFCPAESEAVDEPVGRLQVLT